MARIKKLPLNGHEGKIIYGDNIVDGIVLLAMREVPNVELFYSTLEDKMTNKSIKVFLEKDGVHVDVVVKILHSQKNMQRYSFFPKWANISTKRPQFLT